MTNYPLFDGRIAKNHYPAQPYIKLLLSHSESESDMDPYKLFRETDPRIPIKMNGPQHC